MPPFASTSCRDRTAEYQQIVAALRSNQGASSSSGASEAAGYGAAGAAGSSAAEASSGSAVQQQSEFARRAGRIGQGIAATSQNLLKLSALAKRTGKFDDPAVEIANVSAVIKQDIQALNVALVDLQNLSAASRGGGGGSGGAGKQSASHSSTVVDNLRLRLKDTTKDFQNVLQARKENLERNRARQSQFSSAPDRPALPSSRPGLHGQGFGRPAANGPSSSTDLGGRTSSHQLFGGMGQGLLANGSFAAPEHRDSSEQCVPAPPAHTTFPPAPSHPALAPARSLRLRATASQHRASSSDASEQPLLAERQDQQLVVRQDAYMSSRAAALQNVESTIHELGGIFQQLAHMVQEQGELAIRIDENVDTTLTNVDSAQAQLLKYLNSISSNRWLVMKIFAVLLVFLVVFVVFIA